MTDTKLSIPIATRAYAITGRSKSSPSRNEFPEVTLVFDCETTTDLRQKLTLGVFRVYEGERCIEEGLFYAPDLSHEELQTLKEYCQQNESSASTKYGVVAKRLCLLTLAEFLDRLYRLAVLARALVIGFNLPFDLSRLAWSASEARDPNEGAFSFVLWTYEKDGSVLENPFRPRLIIRALDGRRAVIRFKGGQPPSGDGKKQNVGDAGMLRC